MRRILSVIVLMFLGGCANLKVNESFLDIVLDDNATQNIVVDERWWLGYNEPELNELVQTTLKNNIDIKKSYLNIKKALANLNYKNAEMLPTFGFSTGADISRDISVSSEWSKVYKNSFSVSYELDIWQKLSDAKEAYKFEASASKWDLEALKLSVINSVVSSYFEVLYLNDSLKLYQQNLKNFKELLEIMRLKVLLGKAEELLLRQTETQILSIQNRIINTSQSLDTAKQNLRNLLNLKPENEIKFKDNFDVRLLGANLNVPIYAISNRPDLNAAIDRINEALLNVNISKKSFYPSITLGASLSGSDKNYEDSWSFKILGGNISLNLPFLNYSRLSSNLKVSEANFEDMKLNYIRSLTTALNEIDAAYKSLKNNENLYQNQQISLKNSEEIAKIYKLKYELGKAEFKDYLEAKNSEIEANINIISQKFKLLSDEIAIYKAMAGRARLR